MKAKKILMSVISMILVVSTLSGCSALLFRNKSENAATVRADELTVYDEYESEYVFEEETFEEATVKNEPSHTQIYITSKEDFIAKIKTLIDISLYEENDYESTYSYTMKFDIQQKTEYDFDYGIELGDGTKFALPVPVKTLGNQGWTLNQNPEVKPDNVLSGPRLVNSQGNTLVFVSAVNNSDDTLDFDECDLVGYNIELYSHDLKEPSNSAIDFTVCGTITQNSTLEDIIAKLGNPSKVMCNVVEYSGEYQRTEITITYEQLGSPYNYLEFVLSGDGNYITEMEYSKKR